MASDVVPWGLSTSQELQYNGGAAQGGQEAEKDRLSPCGHEGPHQEEHGGAGEHHLEGAAEQHGFFQLGQCFERELHPDGEQQE
jgi:hypothetical protein